MVDLSDISGVASLLGDRARAAMLVSLMAGRSHTASELARVAGVTKQTASSHLAKLVQARLVVADTVGRYRYFRLADHEVAATIEQLIGLAHRLDAPTIATGPADPALRKARVCYDHLAGELGVLVLDSLAQQHLVEPAGSALRLTLAGERFLRSNGIDIDALKHRRRPLCLPCLDWSARRPHLAGAVGAAILDQCLAQGWARKQKGTRVVLFSALGERALRKRFAYRSP